MKKYTIEDMQNVAKLRDGKCLSTDFFGLLIDLKWQCKEGHTWNEIPKRIIEEKSWCPICMKSRRLNKAT
jgi:hypothetical protein